MNRWKNIAATLDPPIPAESMDRIVPALEALETAFRPLSLSIPQGTGVWTSPEEAE